MEPFLPRECLLLVEVRVEVRLVAVCTLVGCFLAGAAEACAGFFGAVDVCVCAMARPCTARQSKLQRPTRRQRRI